MNGCCAQRNGFEDSLHYSSPAHGGWGVVKTGHLVPDSCQLFVSPAACGRHGALAACLEKRKNRVSYLFLTEEDIVSGGYEERIIEGAGKLLAHLEKRNRMPCVLMIFVSCIDDLLGTDHDALTEELSAAYPHIRFIFCHMNPTSTDTKLPPGVNIQNKIYSLLDVTKERDQGVNLIGSLSPLRQTSELFTVLKGMGVSVIRHISDYEGFDTYQEMARSCLNLVISPAGTYASRQMESKHGTPFVTALTSFRTSCIRDTYSRIADKLRVRCPEFSLYEEECERRMWETAEKLKGMPVLLDCGADGKGCWGEGGFKETFRRCSTGCVRLRIMDQLWISLPALAPDYSGVCSAVFDLGGVTIIHDASGCTGNYTGYDEPRWYGSKAKIFCSGLRDIDAVLGRDDRLIDNAIQAGELVKPSIYTVIGSPVPMVIGSDMKGIAWEIEMETGVPSFGFDTNGLGLYNKGVEAAICALIGRFTRAQEKRVDRGVNILGTNAIDMAANGNDTDLTECLTSWGFTVVGRMMMGASMEQIRNLAGAEVNLVVTESGVAAAKLLWEKFQIPYVVGMPLGKEDEVCQALERTIQNQQCRVICDGSQEGGILIVGEQVLANSMRRAILRQNPDVKVAVGTLYGLNHDIAGEGDINIHSEERLIELIESGAYRLLAGDPLMEELLEGDGKMDFRALPHVALSSKLFWNQAPRFLSKEFDRLLKELAEYEERGAHENISCKQI